MAHNCLCYDNRRDDTHPINNISIKFEIQLKFVTLLFISYATNHNEILHVTTV